MKSWLLLLVIIYSFMTGCSGKGPGVESRGITEQSKEVTEDINDNNVNETTKEASVFYGEYRITSCKGTAIAYAMSQEEIDATIGNVLSYQESTYAFNGNIIDTNYHETIYSVNQMFDDFGIQASKLGIEEKEILLVTALTEGDFIGNYLYVLDENTLLIYYEGVFFEAERIN